MSFSPATCHYLEGTISGWDAGISKMWAYAWFKTSSGATNRALVQITHATIDGFQDVLSLYMDGGNELAFAVRDAGVLAATPTPDDLFFWDTPQLNKWTVACGTLDTSASASDTKLIKARAVAPVIAARTNTAGINVSNTLQALTKIFVGRQAQRVNSNTGTDATDAGTELAYIAIGKDAVPTEANVQSGVDGMHPADMPGVWEYWNLTTAAGGLAGALRGIVLTPVGDAATATFDDADNPSVAGPTGPAVVLSGGATLDGLTAGGGLASLPASTLSGGAVLDGLAAGGSLATAPGVLTSGWLQLNNGFAHTSAPFEALVSNVVTGVQIVRKTGLTSSASATQPTCTFSDAALPAPGTQVRVTWRRTDTGAEGTELLIVS